MNARRFEKDVQKIATMDRESLIRMLHRIHCSFDLDFTDEFLQSVSLERLRHLTIAAKLHSDKKPLKGPTSQAS